MRKQIESEIAEASRINDTEKRLDELKAIQKAHSYNPLKEKVDELIRKEEKRIEEEKSKCKLVLTRDFSTKEELHIFLYEYSPELEKELLDDVKHICEKQRKLKKITDSYDYGYGNHSGDE